jgi:His/Glu/Gln/Arg/opine family amino acid ABC transporter permease subunit
MDNIINDSTLYIAEGIWVTLNYTITSVICGFLLGLLISLCRISKIRIIRYLVLVYISIFRGTPLLVQLSIVYFITPPALGYNISVFEAGVIAFSLNSSAYVAEIIRSGINSVDKGQFESAKALSIPYYLMMKDIVLPQAFRNILPALVNEVVNLLKETAIISVIGGADIIKRAQEVTAEQYIYFTPLITAAVCYYILVVIFGSIAKYIEYRMKLT